MRILHRLTRTALAAVIALCGAHAAAQDEFRPLFNGENLDGWSGDPELWSVENGVIVGSTHPKKIEKNTFLSYGETFSDFVLKISVKLENGNSGIQFRSEQRDNYVVAGYQADVAEKTYFGMLYEEQLRGILPYWNELGEESQKEVFAAAKLGDWNDYVITCEGDRVQFVLNGKQVLDLNDPDGAKSGVIALQLHVGPSMRVFFKDIAIKILGAQEEQALLPEYDATRTEKLGLTGERFRVPEGFRVVEVASNDVTGSAIAMTFDHLGRPVVSIEREGLAILLDEDKDGQFEAKKFFTDAVTSSQGIYYLAPGDVLLHGNGPAGAALYRVRDRDGDDQADEVSTVMLSDGGIGEHGPHSIMRGPDGFLYILYGNHAHPAGPTNPHSQLRKLEEDHILPRYVDPRGHANNIMAPGGTIQRVNPETGVWEEIVGGFRNAYDMSIDLSGELFTFDSDMEWDLGTPWWRPVRTVHAIPGGDYGWRTGSSKMPESYIDTLPPTGDVGRGSPVGTEFYYHYAYPERFHGSFFQGDWSRGRIRISFPKPAGGTFTGRTMDFLLGEPLNVTDMDVAPDGNLYFSAGGRGTFGGLFKVVYEGPDARVFHDGAGVDAVVGQPMPRSAWGREALLAKKKAMGKSWGPSLLRKAGDESAPADDRLRALEALQVYGPKPTVADLTELARAKDARVRAQAVYLLGTYPINESVSALSAALADDDAFVLRRACEALVRAGLTPTAMSTTVEAPVDGLFALLDHDARHVRYSAREALARAPRTAWTAKVQADDIATRPHGALEGLVAWIHTADTPAESDAIFDKLTAYAAAPMADDVMVAYLRTVELAYLRDKTKDADRSALADALKPVLLAKFPASDQALNRELQVMLAHIQAAEAIDPLLAYLAEGKTQEEQIHTAYCLRVIKEGWTREQRDQAVAWFDSAREMRGAASFEGFVNNIWNDILAILPEDERQLAEQRKADQLQRRADEALALMNALEGDAPKGASELASMSFDEMAEYLEYDPMAYREPNLEHGKNVFIRSRCAACHVFGTVGAGGGPDLSTVTSRFRRRDILEAIMYPSKVVSDQYITYEVDLDDLSTVIGMMVGETEETLTLIDINGTRVDIPKSTITERRESDRSVMPEGLLHTMSLGDLVQLVNFLEAGGEDLPNQTAQN